MITYEWRAQFENRELDALHAQGFGHPILDSDWCKQVQDHSLGWVVARSEDRLVDFDDELEQFYFGACGFRPTKAGLIAL